MTTAPATYEKVTAWFAWFPPASAQLHVESVEGLTRRTTRADLPPRPVKLAVASPVDGSTTLHGTMFMPSRRHALTVLRNDVERQMALAKAKHEEMRLRAAVVRRELAAMDAVDEAWS